MSKLKEVNQGLPGAIVHACDMQHIPIRDCGRIKPGWPYIKKIAISTSYIELVEVKFFWYCWVFFLEFSNFRSNIINLMNQYHHLDLIVTKWIFKRLFCKIHIVNMIPLLNQVGNIGLRSSKLERAVMMLYEFTS